MGEEEGDWEGENERDRERVAGGRRLTIVVGGKEVLPVAVHRGDEERRGEEGRGQWVR